VVELGLSAVHFMATACENAPAWLITVWLSPSTMNATWVMPRRSEAAPVAVTVVELTSVGTLAVNVGGSQSQAMGYVCSVDQPARSVARTLMAEFVLQVRCTVAV